MATIEESQIETAKTAYDEVPYPSYPFPQTHPARLATVATLFGMQPANVEHCRVLEIGCASGGNLIPMAELLPESHFLGIDLSQRQVAEGQTTIAAVGLTNVELRCLDILDVSDEMGQFDYIICHGVYSWVPPAVQENILAICKSHLSPQGVAYVSYNTYPGWNMRGTIRDLMCFHAAKVTDPRRRVGEARKFLDFMAQHVPSEKNPYGLLIKTEVERMRQQSDAYLLHDHLEETNSPCYFHEFARAASRNGLQYLGEADLHVMAVGNLGPEVASVIRQIGNDSIETEQYMDFFRNRAFRQTLLCRDNIVLTRNMPAESILNAFISTRLEPKLPGRTSDASGTAQFADKEGRGITNNGPLLTAALLELHHARPQRLRFTDLFELARSRLAGDSFQSSGRHELERTRLAGAFLRLHTRGLVNIVAWAPACSARPQRFPLTSAISRYHAQFTSILANMYHENVQVNDLERRIVQCSDGKMSIEDILQLLGEECLAGKLAIREAGNLIKSVAEAERVLKQLVPGAIERLAACAFFQNQNETLIAIQPTC